MEQAVPKELCVEETPYPIPLTWVDGIGPGKIDYLASLLLADILLSDFFSFNSTLMKKGLAVWFLNRICQP